ncbi:hypothetical protein D3C87_1412740 [compost metagenome]
MGVANGVAQLTAETFLRGGVVEKSLDLGRQAIDDFLKQIIANQPFPTVQRLGQCAVCAGLGRGQQPEPQAGDPAFAALDEVFHRLAAQ